MRLLPFAILSYFLAYIDRINVSFAGLTMRGDLDMSATAFGFALGTFYWGYFIFEVPSNLIMEKGGRAAVDRPHHDRLGPFGRFGHRVDELCRRAIPRCGRGRVLPGAHTVFHLSVSEPPPCPHCFGLSDRESVAPLGAPQRLVRCSKAVITGGR